MNGREERRAAGISRVPVQALVELCGLDPRVAPAFEAESINVSGRGLHVRTGFVPEIGTPLVCRFEERGREIIAEGVVAWASADAGGGEFGLMFTALDQNSVGVLRELTGLVPAEDSGDDVDPAPPADEPVPPTRVAGCPPARTAPPRNEPGARVRLHIEGLGAPMKALVRTASRSRVKVGSTLEMLKVGRRLEIEDLERSARRAACVDAVEVMLDPQSGVPQLVVALHYEDVADVTPDPTVIDDEARLDEVASAESLSEPAPPGVSRRRPASEPAPDLDAFDAAAGDEDEDGEGPPYEDEGELGPEDEVEAEAGRFQGKVAVAAQHAGDAMRRTGTVFARWSGQAAVGIARIARDAGARVVAGRTGAPADHPRRTTAIPPSGVLASDGRRLRPQHPAPAAPVEPPADSDGVATAVGRRLTGSKPLRRAVIGAGLLATAVTLGFFATRDGGDDALAAAAGSVPVAAAPADVTAVDAEGTPRPTSAPPAKLVSGPPKNRDGIVADVPLFGPTPMATLEPAPLGPAPGAADQGVPGVSAEDEAIPAAKVAVADESFDEPVKKGTDSWGRGQVNLPTIHRLRLDHAGVTIQGAPSAAGFSVMLPGVKVMENGTAIARRDDRIAKVTVENTAAGAKVTFRFRSEVPPYRVRLRKDFVEFLISAPK